MGKTGKLHLKNEHGSRKGTEYKINEIGDEKGRETKTRKEKKRETRDERERETGKERERETRKERERETGKERERETRKERERETGKERERETGKERERETGKERERETRESKERKGEAKEWAAVGQVSTRKGKRASVFELDGRPALREALPLALQHVVAMIVGCVTPAIIVAGAASGGGLLDEERVILIQSALFVSALATLLQLFPIGRRGKFCLGSGLPVIMGVSFAYVPTMQAIAADYGIAVILGSQVVGGIVAMLMGFLVKKIRILFPPLITGTVVFTIGLSLYPTAINYMAGGVGSDQYGAPKNWVIAVFTLVIVTVLNHFGRGIWKLASILIGMSAGYLLSAVCGMVQLDSVREAAVFQMPRLLYFGLDFKISACVAMGILFGINAIQAIGDYSATTIGGLGRTPTDGELKSGIVGYGLTNVAGAVFGGLPTATYSQNVGIVTTTKVVNRCVLGLSALILLLAALFPGFSALLTTIPQCVLGGATVSVFASIAMTGMKLVSEEAMNYRNSSIVGLSAALGMGISQASEALSSFPEWVTVIFGKSPVVIATLVAVLLNVILPKNHEMQ